MNWFEKYLPNYEGEGAGGGGTGGGTASPASNSTPAAAPTSTPGTGGGTLDSGVSADASDNFPDIPSDIDVDGALDFVTIGPGASATGGRREPPGAKDGEQSPSPSGEQKTTPEVTNPASAAAPSPVQPVTQQEGGSAEFTLTLDNVDHHFAQAESGLIEAWARDLFAMDEATVEALTTNPETVLPRLLARVLYHATRSVPAQIKNFVPELIRTTSETARVQDAARGEFFDAWPGLKGKNDAAVVRAISTVREQNPKMSRAEVIAMSGKMACIMLGLDAAQVGKPGAGRQVANGGGATVVAPPFRPAGAGASTNGTGGLVDPAATRSFEDEWAGFDLPNSQ